MTQQPCEWLVPHQIDEERQVFMSTLIVVSQRHRFPTPLVYNLGTHTLIITHDYETPDAFELAAPLIDEAALPDGEPKEVTIILDHDETYNLYQCLHTLLFMPVHKNDA